MSKLYACIISKKAADVSTLLSIAQNFTANIELLHDGVLLDLSGLERLIGNAETIELQISNLVNASKLQADIAISESADAALLLARNNSNPTHSTIRSDKFSQLALTHLQIDKDTLNIFHDLGIRTISDLNKIPADDLINRYGREFQQILDVIGKQRDRLLTVNVKENSASGSFDLEFPVENFEQLIFLINHGLDKLFGRISFAGLSSEHLDITLGLRKKSRKSYEIKTSFPTLEKAFWLKLINLRIALDPPESEIVSVMVVAHFTRPRPSQRGLYAVTRPEPENLLLTVNKLKNLVGAENVGVPTLLNQRLSESFTLDSEKLPIGKESGKTENQKSAIAFSYFRPPVRAEVTVKNNRLLHIKTRQITGSVKEYSGVWTQSSSWWNQPWSNREWDIEIENGGLYRLRKSGNEWFLVGEYD